MGKDTGNTGKGNIEARDDWETPQWLFDKLDEQYDFDFDCCATPQNTKCYYHSCDFLNTERINPAMNCWMNPPFSKANKMFNRFFRKVHKGIAIYRCDNIETKLWIEIMKKADWIFVFDGRLNYEGKVGKGARFGSALIGIGLPPPKELNGQLLICSHTETNEN